MFYNIISRKTNFKYPIFSSWKIWEKKLAIAFYRTALLHKVIEIFLQIKSFIYLKVEGREHSSENSP